MTHDHVTGEVVITATEFKAKCLELLDLVRGGAVKAVRITKRGQDVGVLTAPAPATAETWDPASIFGCMKDETVVPEGLDIDGPALDLSIHGEIDPLRGLTRDT